VFDGCIFHCKAMVGVPSYEQEVVSSFHELPGESSVKSPSTCVRKRATGVKGRRSLAQRILDAA